MRYTNPVIPGFWPDPSVCRAGEKFYLAASSFQYFPGVPLFESDDLVNWRLVSHALNRNSQVELADVPSSGGVFAPTLRWHEGRFYMVTNNNSKDLNFYVWADDIRGPWSEPVSVAQGGIDPSLLFDESRVYFISNGEDDEGRAGIMQCEIDITTGTKFTPSRCIWHGAGGRFLEAPHMYHIGEWYYLFAAEGGTEYGHMEVCARSRSPRGPFENCPHNPILTNRNLGSSIIQGAGHGDLVQATDGNWYMVALGFRQTGLWQQYHTLGRETFLIPVNFDAQSWPVCGRDGTMEESYEIPGNFIQERRLHYSFANTRAGLDWVWLRRPVMENYDFSAEGLTLRGTSVTLNDAGSPSFLALRQAGFDIELSVDVSADGDATGGVSVYMNEMEHYDLALRHSGEGQEAVLTLNIGGIHHQAATVKLTSGTARLIVLADSEHYRFFVKADGHEIRLGEGLAKYLSSEVSGGFTGVMLALWATGDGGARFTDFTLDYRE